MSLSLTNIDLDTFLAEYWQKKPFIFRKALFPFTSPLTADELAGLALEEEIESRIVIHHPERKNAWQLKRGPFTENDFNRLPPTNWTLLVQGVDRIVPEIHQLLDNFNFIPQWRLDDIMISFAVKGGGVGPHYDNYDVFLFQAQGQRKWSLTTQGCVETNYLKETDLRIMNDFIVEQEYLLEEGDILYLPAHIGHHGVSMTDDCMTYSFGYRSYPGRELWENMGEYLTHQKLAAELYDDPNWSVNSDSAEIPDLAWVKARNVLEKILQDDALMQNWFASFVTSLDSSAEELFFTEEEKNTITENQFIQKIKKSSGLSQNIITRWAYCIDKDTQCVNLYINGKNWPVKNVPEEFVKKLAHKRLLKKSELIPYIDNLYAITLLHQLWHSNCIELLK